MNLEIDYEQMKVICTAAIDDFNNLGDAIKTQHGTLIHIDNGSDVLAVAHLDSVPNTDHFHVIDIRGEDWVISGQVDDRLGAFIILNMLPSLGIVVDVLLTDSEEKGKSTAQFFKPQKQYKWMVQFDRHGEDIAHYMYGSPRLKKRLEKSGFKNITYGQGSDICKLVHLGCEGFNVAIGYEDEHTTWAKANMPIMARQVNRFAKFYRRYKDTEFVYPFKVEAPVPAYRQSYSQLGGEGSWQRGVPALPGTTYTTRKDDKPALSKIDCLVCKKPVELSSNSLYMCISCCKTHTECPICDKIYDDKDIDVASGVCTACLKAWQDEPVDKFTHAYCLQCHSARLFIHEVIENMGLCDKCERGQGMGIWF